MAASLEQNRAKGNVNDGCSGFFDFGSQGRGPQITQISQIFHSLIGNDACGSKPDCASREAHSFCAFRANACLTL
jgi:hypothetical protein